MKRNLTPAWQTSAELGWQASSDVAANNAVPGPRSPYLDADYWIGILQRQWRLVATIFCAGVALTLLAVVLIPPRFAATATIVLDNHNVPVVFGAPAPIDPESKLKIDDEIEILGSRRIAEHVFSKLEPSKSAAPEATAEKRSWWELFLSSSQAKTFTPPQAEKQAPVDSADHVSPEPPVQDARVDALMGALVVERKGRSNVINVSFVDKNPLRAARIANAFVDAYVGDQLNEKAAGARREIEELQRQVEEASKQLEEIEQRQPIGEFKREIEVASTLYATVLQRYNEKRAQEKLLAPDVRIVSYAVAPARPFSPKKSLILALSGIAWLGIGIGAALARERAHPVLRSPKDVERALGVPCVAELPVVDPTSADGDDDAPLSLAGPIHAPIEEQRSWQFSRSAFALSQWTDASANGDQHIVVVVSAHRAEGRSTVAMQLARNAAATGRSVLLVDADLRNFGLTDVLGGAQPTTFAERVGAAGENSCDFVAVDEGLSFCPAVQRGSWSPLEIVGSRGMGKFFGSLQGKFDLIVVDTPSMADGAETEALVAHASLVLVVVKANETEIGDACDVIERVGNGHAPVGVVLNMVAPAAGH